MQIQRVLVPVDFSTNAELAVDYARVLANALAASITLVHIINPPNSMVGIVPGASIERDLSAERVAANQLMERQRALLREHGFVSVEIVIEVAASTTDAIVERARAGHYDLIVMGTHGRRGVSRLLMGSVAEQVMRRSTCPIMMVHLPEADR